MAAQARAQCRRGRCSRSRSAATATSPASARCARPRPHSRIILDANEGWTDDNIGENLAAAAELGVALIEQPLPAGKDAILGRIARPVPVCADESVHTADDLDALAGLYDAVNIKLDKAGGLTAALLLRDRARELGFPIMVGCMVGTSLAMAPAVLLAQGADFVDLDGPLLLARDRAARPDLPRIAGVTARAGALGLSAAASTISPSPTSAIAAITKKPIAAEAGRRAAPTASVTTPSKSRWRRRRCPARRRCAPPAPSRRSASARRSA